MVETLKSITKVPKIRFYMKNGRWKVTSDGKVVPAREWWDAIAQVKCMNHKLRMEASAQKQK